MYPKTTFSLRLPRCLLTIVTLLLTQLPLWAQTHTRPKLPKFTIGGQLSLNNDLMLSSDTSLSNTIYSRPPWFTLARANVSLGLGKYKIPVSVSFMLPSMPGQRVQLTKPNLKEYLLMPGNNFGIQPTFKKLTIMLGTHTAKYSTLSAGNIAFATGLGFAWCPGKWQFKASHGITRRFIARDSASGIAGQYERWMFAAKVGVGDEKKNHIYFQLLQSKDSVKAGLLDSLRPKAAPRENLLFSTKFRIGLFKTFYLRFEVAASLYSVNREAVAFNDSLLGDYKEYLDKIAPYFGFNTATSVGAAADVEVGIQRKNWNFGTGFLFRSAGYQSLAYFNQVNDVLNMTAKLSLKMFKQKLQIDGNGAVRVNNLQGTKTETQGQVNATANASWQVTKRIYISANYCNFGTRDVQQNYTSSLQQVTQNLGIYPSITLGKKENQSLSFNANRDAYTDYNFNNGQEVSVESTSGGLNYQIVTQQKMGISFGGNGFRNGLPGSIYNQWNGTFGLRQTLWKNRLQLMGQFQYGFSQRPHLKPTELYGIAMNASLRLGKKINLSLQINARKQTVAVPTGVKEVEMFTARNSIQYNF